MLRVRAAGFTPVRRLLTFSGGRGEVEYAGEDKGPVIDAGGAIRRETYFC
jgi:hypothetical protein